MNRSFTRRTVWRVLACACAVASMSAASLVHAAYPERLVRVINPYAAGGAGDMIARELANGMQMVLNANAISDNRPGGGTVIGSDLVAKSPADGYTILMIGPATHVIMPAIHPKLPYNADKDFDLLGMFAIVGNMISVHPSVPVNNLKELIEYAKKNPGKLNYSSAGVGTGPHLAGETFKAMTGVDLAHVPYKGAAPAVTGIVGNEVQVTTVNIPPQVPFIKSNRLRPIVVATSKRSSMLPDVPTAAEAGLPGYISESWFAVAVPAGTPAEARNTIRRAMVAIGNDAARRTRLAGAGIELSISTPEELAAYIRAERGRLLPVIKKLDLKID